MKNYSQYIINESKVKNFNKLYPYIINQIVSFAQLDDIIKQINNEELTNKFKELFEKFIKIIKIEHNEKLELTIDNLKSQKNIDEFIKKTNKPKDGAKQQSFIDRFKNINIDDFTKLLDKSMKNESYLNISNVINESNETTNSDNLKELIEKLKTTIEAYKDKYKNLDKTVPNNYYTVAIRIIDNYTTFADILNDEDKEKLKKSIESVLIKLNQTNNTTSTVEISEPEPNVNNTEEKVVESKYIKQLTEKIEGITPENLSKTFLSVANDDIKKHPDGIDYLGLTIYTIGVVLLKETLKDNDKVVNYIKNI